MGRVPGVDDERRGVLTRAELLFSLCEVLADELLATRLRASGRFGRAVSVESADEFEKRPRSRSGEATGEAGQRAAGAALTSTCSSVSLYLVRSRLVESQPGRWSSNTTLDLVFLRYSGCDRIRSPGLGGTFIAPRARCVTSRQPATLSGRRGSGADVRVPVQKTEASEAVVASPRGHHSLQRSL